MNSPDVFHAAGLGLGTGLALIVAIGAQNAFVLRQGIRGEHIGAVVAVCAISDAVLIAAGYSAQAPCSPRRLPPSSFSAMSVRHSW
ncbi:putative amino-acid transporter Mb2008 [Arthrobacter sp. Hiyo8]|nr:putative amino-acid transporter Mb2008 [Arthrobacter sp. Hiyo8]